MSEKRKLKYVTLIWEELPEKIRLFVIPRSEISKSDIRMLRACHRNYINAVGKCTDLAPAAEIDRALVMLYNMICDPGAEWITDSHKQQQAEQLDLDQDEFDAILGKWSGYELDSDRPQTIPRSKMYRSGFLL